MGRAYRAARRAAIGLCAIASLAGLASCEGAFGTSPPHAAPANPVAIGMEGAVRLTWGAVTDASRYVILWDNNEGAATFDQKIEGITETEYLHEGLEDLRRYRYRIVAETSGGRGPQSVTVSATPGPVPGAVEWAVVTAQNPGHTIHFSPTSGATGYRIYFSAQEALLAGLTPTATFVTATGSPHVRPDVTLATAVYYRVVPMNDSRAGVGSPVAIAPARVIRDHELEVAGVALGIVDDDFCLDLPTALNDGNETACTGVPLARDLDEAGLGDLLAGDRAVGDARFADFDGDGFDDLFTNTSLPAGDPDSQALLHMNDGTGEFATSAVVTALGIAGVGGTLLAADFDNDGDVDLFVPNDQSQGDGARNWLLINDGTGAFTDAAAAAGVDTNPAGDAYVPAGGQAVDFDEDGFVDLLFGSRLLLNNGDGTFRDGSVAANMPVLADQGLKLIDVDLDGDLDLVHNADGETRLFRNTGGVFDGGELVGAEAEATVGRGLNVCDVNGDGFEDVVVARNDPATLAGTPKFLLNVDGTLALTATQEGITDDPDSLVAPNGGLACGDLDRNGITDVLARWGDEYRSLRPPTPLSRTILLRIVGADGERNQQGRVVRIVPRSAPTRVMTRVVDGGSGLRAQNMYDLLVGVPWAGVYDVTVRFADGEVTTTAEAGDQLAIRSDGEIEDLAPDAAP